MWKIIFPDVSQAQVASIVRVVLRRANHQAQKPAQNPEKLNDFHSKNDKKANSATAIHTFQTRLRNFILLC